MNETNEKVTCYFCGEVIEKNDVMEFSGKTLCRNCYDANVTTCECCGDLIWDSDSRGDENITLCQDCYDDHYTHCETCNRIIHNEDAYYLPTTNSTKVTENIFPLL